MQLDRRGRPLVPGLPPRGVSPSDNDWRRRKLTYPFNVQLDRGERLRDAFSTAEPFPLIVLDDFLVTEFAAQLVEEFPSLDAMPKSRDYMFADKRELSSVERGGPAGTMYRDAMLSDPFSRFLSDLTGHELFVDPDFFGGGFHQGGDGSFLDMHVDFNVHPLHGNWLRTLNILVYLNVGWREEFGGQLLVKNGVDGPIREIAPAFNRAVIMLTDDRTYHGYRKMALPDGVTRKSLAAYAYRHVEEGAVTARTTGWAPEGASAVKRFLARHYNRAVKVKHRFFGSATARNR